MSHTPGPWEIVDERTVYGPPNEHGSDRFICDVGDTLEALEGDCPEADANARLIAAAPDLLYACISALDDLRDYREEFANDGGIDAQECLRGLDLTIHAIESSVAKAAAQEVSP